MKKMPNLLSRRVLVGLAALSAVPLAVVSSFLLSERERASSLASFQAYPGLYHTLTSIGFHNAIHVFGGQATAICILPAYSTTNDIAPSRDVWYAQAIASAPPSEDLSWRLLVASKESPRWYVQDEVMGASLTQGAKCFDMTPDLTLIIEPVTDGKKPSRFQATFLNIKSE